MQKGTFLDFCYLLGWDPAAAPSGDLHCPKQPGAAEIGVWALQGFCQDQNKSFKAVPRGEFEVMEKRWRRRRKKCVHGSEEVGEAYMLWAAIPCCRAHRHVLAQDKREMPQFLLQGGNEGLLLLHHLQGHLFSCCIGSLYCCLIFPYFFPCS